MIDKELFFTPVKLTRIKNKVTSSNVHYRLMRISIKIIYVYAKNIVYNKAVILSLQSSHSEV